MRPSKRRVLYGGIVVVFTIGVFLRGNYLSGFRAGVASALVSMAVVILALNAASQCTQSRWKLRFYIALAIFVGLAVSFPSLINPKVRYGIEAHAADRSVQTELNSIFESDQRFDDLSTKSQHLKVVVVTVSGTIDNMDSFGDLQDHVHLISERHPLVLVRCQIVDRETGKVIDNFQA